MKKSMKNVHDISIAVLHVCVVIAYSIIINALMLETIFSFRYHVIQFALFWTVFLLVVASVSFIITYYCNTKEGILSDSTADQIRLLTISVFVASLLSEFGWLYQLIFHWHTPFL
jgi:hypothetical protein